MTEEKKYTEQFIRTQMGDQELIRLAEQFGVPSPRTMGDTDLRNAVVRGCGRNRLLVADAQPATQPTAASASASAPSTTATVQVQYGAYDQQIPVAAGQTLGALLERLRVPFSMDLDQLRVYVNGSEVTRDRWATTVMEAGARIEALRPSGEKGGR